MLEQFRPLPYLSLVIASRSCNGLCDIDLGEMYLCLSLFGLSRLGASTLGLIVRIYLRANRIRQGIYCYSMQNQSHIFIVITVSRSTWMTTKINGVATDLFCTGVIGHLGCNVLKLVTEIPNLKQHN